MFSNFWRQREQRDETPRQRHVSRYADGFRRRAAVDHRGELRRRRRELDIATVDFPPFDVERAVVKPCHIARFAEAEAHTAVNPLRQPWIEHCLQRKHYGHVADREARIMKRAARRPFAHLPDHRRRLETPFGRFIDLDRRGRRQLRSAHQPPLLTEQSADQGPRKKMTRTPLTSAD